MHVLTCMEVFRLATKLDKPILDAAAKLFAERGYNSTSTKDIAKSADVNESTIFRLFKDKESLFEATLAHEIEKKAVSSDFVHQLKRDTNFKTAVENSVFLAYEAYSSEYVRLSMFAALEKPEIMSRFFRDRVLPRFKTMTAKVRQEQKAGRARSGKPEAMVVALYLANYMHALFRYSYQRGDKFPEMKLADADCKTLINTWLHGVLKNHK